MSARDELDRRLAYWMKETAASPPPAGRFEQAIETTARRQPRPRWRARFGADLVEPAFSPPRGLILAVVLAIGLVGTAVVAGGLSRRDVVVPPSNPTPTLSGLGLTGPSQAVPTPTVRPTFRQTPRLYPGLTSNPRADLCPGGTLLSDIWDTSVAGNDMDHWTLGDARPLAALGAGGVAIIVPVAGGPTEVRILDPLTARSCLLLELPGGSLVQDAQWSPSGNALAIDMNEYGVYVWSGMGTTRPMLPDGGPLAWSPDGSRLAVSSTTGMWVVPYDGATPIQLHCDPPGRNVECPAGPRLLWSPGGDRLVMASGDRMDSNPYGPASMLDPVFHQIAVAPALDGATPIGWLDSQTLIEGSDSQLFEVSVDDKTHYRERASPPGWSGEPIFSPDERLAAFGSLSQPVRVLDVASGREKVVIGPTQLGADVDYDVAWASDSRSLVASAERQSVDQQGIGMWTPLGLWVLNPDGSGLRKLISGRVWVVGTANTESQRAALQSYLARAFDGPTGSPGAP